MQQIKKTLIVDLDGKCNCRCLFCCKMDMLELAPVRSRDDALKSIRQAIAEGIPGVDFFGGEPTMYPFLKELIMISQENRLRVTLATNAMIFSSKKYTENFFNGLSRVIIRTSLFSHGPQVHDRITLRSGSWKKTVDGIGNILLFEKALTVNNVINSWNYKELSAWTEYLYSLNVRSIKYSALKYVGGAKTAQHLWVKDAEFGEYFLEAVRLAAEIGFEYIELENIPEGLVKQVNAMKIKAFSHA